MAHMKLLGAMVADTVSENAVPVAESARAKSEAAESITLDSHRRCPEATFRPSEYNIRLP